MSNNIDFNENPIQNEGTFSVENKEELANLIDDKLAKENDMTCLTNKDSSLAITQENKEKEDLKKILSPQANNNCGNGNDMLNLLNQKCIKNNFINLSQIFSKNFSNQKLYSDIEEEEEKNKNSHSNEISAKEENCIGNEKMTNGEKIFDGGGEGGECGIQNNMGDIACNANKKGDSMSIEGSDNQNNDEKPISIEGENENDNNMDNTEILESNNNDDNVLLYTANDADYYNAFHNFNSIANYDSTFHATEVNTNNYANNIGMNEYLNDSLIFNDLDDFSQFDHHQDSNENDDENINFDAIILNINYNHW